MLQKVLIEEQKKFNMSLVGKIQEVLFHKVGKHANQYIGKNVYNQSVVIKSKENMIGKFKNVLIKSAEENCVIGEIA